MSRWVEVDQDSQTVTEEIASMDECRHMLNEICCNDESDQFCEFVDSDYCKICPQFQEEDGIIAEE